MFTVEIWQHTLQLQTDPRLFSPSQADKGTLAMLSVVRPETSDRVLDLGCGYGLVGLAAASVVGPEQVIMIDIDPLAVSQARQNASLNGFPGIRIVEGDGPAAAGPDHFSLILCNPPYHTDFAVAKRLIEQSFQMLDTGGRLFLVVKRLVWYRNKMTAVFGGVRVNRVDDYYVLSSIKRLSAPDLQTDGKTAGKPTRKHLKRLQVTADRKNSRKMKKNSPTGNG